MPVAATRRAGAALALWLLTVAPPVAAEPPGPPSVAGAAGAPEAKAPPAAEAEAEFERRFIGFERVIYYRSPKAGGPSALLELATRWGTPFVGSDRRPLDRRQLFAALERADLVEATDGRALTRRVLVGAGAALLGGGLGLAVGGGVAGEVRPFCFEQDRAGTCIDADRSANLLLVGIGTGVAVGGIVALAVGLARRLDPVDEREIHRLVLEHNRALRRQLGLPARDDSRYPGEADNPPVIDPGSLPPPPPPPPVEEPKLDPRLRVQ